MRRDSKTDQADRRVIRPKASGRAPRTERHVVRNAKRQWIEERDVGNRRGQGGDSARVQGEGQHETKTERRLLKT